MTALEFMREVVRMCRSCKNCSQCVIDGYESCLWIDGDFSPEKFVQDVTEDNGMPDKIKEIAETGVTGRDDLKKIQAFIRSSILTSD